MLGKFFDTIWPLKELLNYIFKKSLGNYITNELDLNRIEIEIKNKAFISLKNLELNAQEINNKHLRNSAIKMLDGRISRLDLYISKDKIEFKVDEIFILLMPVFNLEKINGNKFLKKQGVNIKMGKDTDKEIGTGEKTHAGQNYENLMISNLLNSALSNLEISMKNICIKILTYEVCNNAQDNPTFSIYLSKVEYKSKPMVEKITNTSHVKEKLFLFDKQIIFDKFCVKVNKNFNYDEINFFDLSNLNDEKLLFNFFCDNSTILAINYSHNDTGDHVKDKKVNETYKDMEMTLEENLKKRNDASVLITLNKADKDPDGLKIDIALKRLEIILNPLQLEHLINFLEVCRRIFSKRIGDIHIDNDIIDDKNKVNSSRKNKNDDNYSNNSPPHMNKPIKIFNSKISNIIISLNLEMFNCILIENKYSYEVPKLWSFFENNYSKEIKTFDNLQSHFSYIEDNFFLLNINNINLRHTTYKLTAEEKVEYSLESLYLKYTEYKNKILREKSEKKLKFTNSRLHMLNAGKRSMNNSPYNNMINLSNVSYFKTNMSIYASTASQRVNEHSLNQTIYQSVESDLIRNNSKDSSHNSVQTLYESAMESELILVNKFNKLLEYDYFYHSFSLICMTPEFKSENICLQLKLVKSISFIEKKKESVEKKYVSLTVGDFSCEFHPVFLFKFAKLYRNNVVLINEVLFYCTNLWNEKNQFNSNSNEDGMDVNLNTNNSEGESERNTRPSLKSNKHSNKDESISSGSIPLSAITNWNESLHKKRIISQFYFVFNEIKFLLSGFSNDSGYSADDPLEHRNPYLLNYSYFKNFYQNNIQDVLNIRNAEGPGYKINIIPDASIQTLKSKEKIQIKLSRTSVLITSQEKHLLKLSLKNQPQKKPEILIKFSQLLLYLNDHLITNYQKDNESFIPIVLNNSFKNISNISSSKHNVNSNFKGLVINESYTSQFSKQPSYTHVINKNPNKNFITGNYLPHKSIEDTISHDENQLDSLFSRNKMKFRNSDIKIDMFSLGKEDSKDIGIINEDSLHKEGSNSLDINKHISQYLEKIHNQYGVKENIYEIISRIFNKNIEPANSNKPSKSNKPGSNINRFSRGEVTIDINEISIDVDMNILTIISRFLEGFLFSINMFKIFNLSLKQLQQGIKEKIFDLYEIKSIKRTKLKTRENTFTNTETNTAAYLNVDKHTCESPSDYSHFNLNLLNLSIQKINISINKLSSQDESHIIEKNSNIIIDHHLAKNNLIHCVINKINTSLITINENHQVFFKLNNLMVNLLTQRRNLTEDINPSVMIHRVIYNGETIVSDSNSNLTRCNLLELKLDFKEKKSYQQHDEKSSLTNFLKEWSACENIDNNLLSSNNFIYESIEDFLSNNKLKQNDIQMNISLITSNLILAPIFKNFEQEIFIELYKQVIAAKDLQTLHTSSPLIQLIDQRSVDLFLDIKLKNLAIDLFYHDVLLDPKDWMRLIISVEQISYVLDNKNSSAKFENFVINLLRDLRIEEADGLLSDKIINIGKEDSKLKKFGFVDIVNCDSIRLNLMTKNNFLATSNHDEENVIRKSLNNQVVNPHEKENFRLGVLKNITKENKIDIVINALEFKFCRDSFLAFRTFIDKMNEISTNLVKGVNEARKVWMTTGHDTTTNTKTDIIIIANAPGNNDNNDSNANDNKDDANKNLNNVANNNDDFHTKGVSNNLTDHNESVKSDNKNIQTFFKPIKTEPKQKSTKDLKLESAFNLKLFEDYYQDDYRVVEVNPNPEGKKESIRFITGLSDTKQSSFSDVNTIPLQNSINIKHNSKRKRSSFEILKDPESFADQYTRTKENTQANIKFQKETSINFSLNSVRIYLFEGNDYDFYYTERFAYSKNKNLFLSHASNVSHASLAEQNSSNFDIIEDYLGSDSLPGVKNNMIPSQISTNSFERKRISFRDYDNQICSVIQNFQVEGVFVHKIAVSNSEYTMTRVKIRIYKFDIDDYVKSSKYKKLLSKYEYDNKQPLIEVDIETKNSQDKEEMSERSVRNFNVSDAELEEVEVYIDVKVLPINILLDQVTLIFLLDFFEVKLGKNRKIEKTEKTEKIEKLDRKIIMDKLKKNEKKGKLDEIDKISIEEKENFLIDSDYNNIRVNENTCELSSTNQIVQNINKENPLQEIFPKDKNRKDSIKLIFVRRVKLEEFFINFSYNSHSISIERIKNKNYLELLNLSNISDFRIILKEFEFFGCLSVQDTIEMLINFWKEDITKNQIFSALLRSVSLIRPFFTILRGFFDIFKQPWIYYKTEKSLRDGISKGIKNFIFSLSSESLFLGEKIFVTLKNHLGSPVTGNQGNNLGKNSYYKKFIYYMNDSKKKYDEYYLKK